MHQRLIQTASRFVTCTHPPRSVGALVLYTPGDTLEPTKPEPTGSSWCSLCGSLRTGPETWRSPTFRFEIAVAAGAAVTAEEALTAKVDEARVCMRELASILRETASAPVTGATPERLEAIAHSAELMADGFEALAREFAAPAPPLESIDGPEDERLLGEGASP